MFSVYGPQPPKMICHHSPGDRSCTTQFPPPPEPPVTPDASKYEVEDAVEVGAFLVMKVKYPNCRRCAYEGTKVLVFRGVSTIDALKWKKIDPHFRDPKRSNFPTEAPTPVARFPASDEGWADAQNYVRFKTSDDRR